MNKYRVMIGLEMHCEISQTNTKVFSSAANNFNEIPNSNIRPVDMAFPGTLPTLNIEALKKSLTASIILNCKMPEYIYFERKNYYYPDLPKGYQITQETKPAPVGVYGYLEYNSSSKIKKIRINNIHLEEDTASQDHYDTYSLLDYNRAGAPLLELVTEPDFRTSEEVVDFLEMMRLIYQYADISEADPKKGHIRCDVNVSIMDSNLDENNPENWGTKVEVKNVNSIGGVREAIEYEIIRQTEAKENGTYDYISQETRRWDEFLRKTVFMRDKVDAIDYKYFVEPNIPKYKVTSDFISEIKSKIPVLPSKRLDTYLNEYKINEKDANTLIKNKDISDYFDECIILGINPNTACNWVLTQIIGYLNKEEITINGFYLNPSLLKIIIDNINEGVISSKQAKEVFLKSLEEHKSPENFISKENSQVSDEKLLEDIIDNILLESPEQIKEYKNGKTNLFQYFVGRVMKETKGKANPSLTSKILENKLK